MHAKTKKREYIDYFRLLFVFKILIILFFSETMRREEEEYKGIFELEQKIYWNHALYK